MLLIDLLRDVFREQLLSVLMARPERTTWRPPRVPPATSGTYPIVLPVSELPVAGVPTMPSTIPTKEAPSDLPPLRLPPMVVLLPEAPKARRKAARKARRGR